MQLDFIRQDYVTYCTGYGKLCCHVDAIHAAPPENDLFTDDIVTLLIAHTGCAGIIGTVSRLEADLNRYSNGKNDMAIRDYRSSIRNILFHLGILEKKDERVTTPYLHLAIHGMKDSHYGPYGIEIGTRCGESCSQEIKEWLVGVIRSRAHDILPQLQIVVDHKFVGDESITCHRLGDGQDYRGYGPHFNTFQIEIARTLRQHYRPQIVELLSIVIFHFQAAFVGPRSGG